MNKRAFNLAIAFIVTLIQEIVLIFLHASNPDNRLIILLGGNLPDGIIQSFTFMLFYFGVLETTYLLKYLNLQELVLFNHYLPEDKHKLLTVPEVLELRLEITKKYELEKNLLLELIKKSLDKFRSDKSAIDVLNVLSEQVNIKKEIIESEMSFIRYVIWAIPSVGFIGTVWGISKSMAYANEATTTEGIDKITSALSVAFDTTLVALFLSLILMFLFHKLDEKLGSVLSKIEAYIIDNLINRIYK